jgi:hypothetical protein
MKQNPESQNDNSKNSFASPIYEHQNQYSMQNNKKNALEGNFLFMIL